MIGIYRITAPSGRIYLGMTCDSFKSRWATHIKTLRSRTHPNQGLSASFAKYGLENLSFEIIEAWDKPSDPNKVTELRHLVRQREQYWWDELKRTGSKLYNGRPNANGSVCHTAETREMIRQAVTLSLPLEEIASLQMIVDTCLYVSEAVEKTGMSKGKLQRRGVDVSKLVPKPPVRKKKDKVIIVKSPVKKKLVEDRLDFTTIASLYKRGESLKDIATLYETTGPTIARFLKSNGIATRSRYEYTAVRLNKMRKNNMEEVRLVEDTVSKAAED